jgi:hypothetical protein
MNMDRDQLMMMMRLMNPELAPLFEMMENQVSTSETKPKKRRTAYQRRYKAAFKKVQKRYKLKSGKWKKGGFRSAVREAHKMAKRGRKK